MLPDDDGFGVPSGWYPDGSTGKEYACNSGDAGDMSLIPGSGRSPGGGYGNPLQYSCLENPVDRGAWRAWSMGVAKRTQLKWLNTLSGWVKLTSRQSLWPLNLQLWWEPGTLFQTFPVCVCVCVCVCYFVEGENSRNNHGKSLSTFPTRRFW